MLTIVVSQAQLEQEVLEARQRVLSLRESASEAQAFLDARVPALQAV